MAGYTKLFASIVHSTIWREPAPTKVVWITMLALADRRSRVEASIPGLADLARVTIQECEAALAALMSPDPYSRTKDHEGRRIEETRGGWVILNHAAYRDELIDESRRASAAERARRYRAKKGGGVTQERDGERDGERDARDARDGGGAIENGPQVLDRHADRHAVTALRHDPAPAPAPAPAPTPTPTPTPLGSEEDLITVAQILDRAAAGWGMVPEQCSPRLRQQIQRILEGAPVEPHEWQRALVVSGNHGTGHRRLAYHLAVIEGERQDAEAERRRGKTPGAAPARSRGATDAELLAIDYGDEEEE